MLEDQDQLLYLLLVDILENFISDSVTEHECKQQLLMVIQAMLENVRG